MREIRPYGSEVGAALRGRPYPYRPSSERRRKPSEPGALTPLGESPASAQRVERVQGEGPGQGRGGPGPPGISRGA